MKPLFVAVNKYIYKVKIIYNSDILNVREVNHSYLEHPYWLKEKTLLPLKDKKLIFLVENRKNPYLDWDGDAWHMWSCNW